MLTAILTKFDAKQFAHTAKIILMTLFTGYAAAHSAGAIIKNSMLENIHQYYWYMEFLLFFKIIYGVASGGIFYIFILHKNSRNSR